ncbi:nucleoside 5-triphosphatase RdgB [Desulfocucumis palustris]|uniref:Nucleoside 5-triphosphatase RdgB n=1 Tax=Desulfocucumis palustris TaxID=1898651 RepID=A0A2L2XH60_9FIRM|nr:non-canonical purine NTP pyrophosphatase [Desulfocucumis palustris]GBF35545.1 nucleoside 5-triphosphatase RdgB [Desulfocucumis palustris]
MGILRFVSSSELKITEYRELLQPVEFAPLQLIIRETFSDDPRDVVREKVLKAYETKRAPLFVDHTGLFIDELGGIPGPFTQLFWKRMNVDGLLSLIHCKDSRGALVRTTIGYCDGRQIHYFEGEVRGTIAREPAGCVSTWMCLFIPDGFDITMAEMTREQKNAFSHRRLAADKFKQYLTNPAGGVPPVR